MRKLVTIVCIALTAVTLFFSSPASAEPDLAIGKQVFGANCVACHKGGANLVMASKNLKKATLAQYGMDSMDAIQTQVARGKNAMPAFSGRLDPHQIESVAAYVLAQADADWK
ncbi:MAG: cytochrome c6 PetJ [Synechococcus sp.]